MKLLEIIGELVATKCTGATEVYAKMPHGKIIPIGDVSYIGELTGDGKKSITLNLDGDDSDFQRFQEAAEELLDFLDEFPEICDSREAKNLRWLLK